VLTETPGGASGREAFVTPAALEISNIVAGYGRTVVLRDVSVVVPCGSVTALIGPNGAGKTTLLRTASGLLRPTEGRVLLNGVDVTAKHSDWRARSGLCHVPEERGTYPSLTVRENLMMQVPKRLGRQAIDRAVSMFPDLGRRLEQVAGTLSGGQQQMLSLSAAYVRDPSVVVIDEPSLGLAPIIIDEVFAFIGKLAGDKVGLLVVDQFVERVLELADRVYVLQRGVVQFEGLAEEFKSADTFAMYMGDYSDGMP
jgi:branched-chain amino acid transport system ATP-binding protein